MKPKLYLDFDGVIGNTVKAVCQLYHQDYALYDNYEFIHPEDVDTWNFEEFTLAKKSTFYKYFNTKRFFDVLEPMPGATQIKSLYCDFDIKICTIGTRENLRGKDIWLSQNIGGNYELIGLIGVHDKSAVDMSGAIFVDDKASNLETSNARVKICFGEVHEWNREWNGIHCKDWKELMDELEKITSGGE